MADEMHVLIHVPEKRTRPSRHYPAGRVVEAEHEYYRCDAGDNAKAYFGYRTYRHIGMATCWDCDAQLMRPVMTRTLAPVEVEATSNG